MTTIIKKSTKRITNINTTITSKRNMYHAHTHIDAMQNVICVMYGAILQSPEKKSQ